MFLLNRWGFGFALIVASPSGVAITTLADAATPAPVPQSLPSFPVVTLDGGRVLRLATLRGHPVVINFWASWCVPCRAELASLDRLAASHPRDLTIIAASVDADPRQGRAAFGSAYPHLRLAFSSLSSVQQYGALGMPYSIVLDAKGLEVKRVAHAIDWSGEDGAKTLSLAK